MNCPFCSATDTEVYNSRASGPYRIWRRRRCSKCKKTFTTYESIDLNYLKVTVPGGTYRRYQRHLLFNSIYEACRGLKSRTEAVDSLTNTVESKLLARQKDSVASSEIAQIILKTLKPFSLNAYMHYLADHANLENVSQLKTALKDS